MTNRDIWTRASELLGEAELSRRFRAWATNLVKRELARRSNMTPDEFSLKQAGEILEDLNALTGRRYTLTQEALNLIRGRLAAGYGVEDFKRMHRVMCAKWLADEKMRPYLRPSTLYRASHFDEYLALAHEAPKAPAAAERRQRDHKAADRRPPVQEVVDEALVQRLLARPWWEFDSWAEFMRWTMQFPDDKSLAQYEMPERIKRMRTAPGMVMKILRGSGAEWAEKEYQEIKNARENG